jgi:hypothetical protein
MHELYKSQSAWYIKWNDIVQLVADFLVALSIHQKNFISKKKCAAFTVWHLTANCKSMQISESVNAATKQKGHKNCVKNNGNR